LFRRKFHAPQQATLNSDAHILQLFAPTECGLLSPELTVIGETGMEASTADSTADPLFNNAHL
jgi:hypothetical protein